MNNKNSIKNGLAISAIIAMIALTNNGLSTVQAELFKVHSNDIINHYTYQGMSKLLSGGENSYEDVDQIKLLIENTDMIAVYDNLGSNGNFVFQYIIEVSN